MFTTLMLRPPMPPPTNLLEMLHSFETWILGPTVKTTVATQVDFVSQKNTRKPINSYQQKKKEFSSQNRGLQPAVKEHPKT